MNPVEAVTQRLNAVCTDERYKTAATRHVAEICNIASVDTAIQEVQDFKQYENAIGEYDIPSLDFVMPAGTTAKLQEDTECLNSAVTEEIESVSCDACEWLSCNKDASSGCVHDFQCSSRDCMNGRCVVELGEGCEAHSDCASGYCASGKCAYEPPS